MVHHSTEVKGRRSRASRAAEEFPIVVPGTSPMALGACLHSACTACTAHAQHAHDRRKLGVFATTGKILACTDHTTPPTIAGQPYASPHPHPPPSHPRPRIVTITPQQLLVQPTQGILVRQPISHPQQVCFARDGTLSTPFRSGRCNRGRTWQGLLSLPSSMAQGA